MNTGAFGEGFPYSNFHDLNMDWIIKIAKDFLDQYTHIQQIIADGEQSLSDLTEDGLAQLQEKADTLEGLLQAWYNQHSQDIADQLADALSDLNAWYTTHQNYLDQTLTTNINLFDQHAEEKASETIESIPADYTAVANEALLVHNAVTAYQEFPYLQWTIGSSITSAGQIESNPYRAISDPFPVSPNDVIIRKTPARDANNIALMFYINTYSGNVWQERIALNYDEYYVVDNNIDYIRLDYGRQGSSGTPTSQTDIGTYFKIIMYGDNEYFTQRYGNTFNGTAFSELIEFGAWNISGSKANSMTDKPTSNIGGGTLINIPSGSNPKTRTQIYYDIVNNSIYSRYFTWNNTTNEYNTPTEWIPFNFNFSLKPLKDTTTLSSNVELGLYRMSSFSQAPTSSFTDMPISNYEGGYMLVTPAGTTNGVEQTLVDIINGYVFTRFIHGVNLDVVEDWNKSSDIKWVAVGDSVTYGVYSTGASSTAVNKNLCYAQQIANKMRVQKFNNMGIRGLGFVQVGNNNETLKTDIIDTVTWTDYNLATIALGVNDYGSNKQLGNANSTAWDGTISGSIRGTIENILTANPEIKIIFITPFNTSRSGSLSSHWARSYNKSNTGSLTDLTNMIIHWCNFYGIEYINETDASVINDLNIQSLMLDGLHPSLNTHTLLAHELYKKINFG